MIEVLAYTKGSSGMSEGRVVCMELDTNHDGTLDLLRVFSDKGDLDSAIEEMLSSDGPFVLDVLVPYQEHVLPMIPGGATVRDIIKA